MHRHPARASPGPGGAGREPAARVGADGRGERARRLPPALRAGAARGGARGGRQLRRDAERVHAARPVALPRRFLPRCILAPR